MTKPGPSGPLVPIDRSSSLGELAYHSLKETIIGGAFSPGEKLTVRSVAQALGVSTTPARDALNRLIAEGALENLGPKTVVVPVLTRSVLDEVTAIRIALEGLASYHAAPHATPADVTELERLQENINQGLDRGAYTDVLKHNKAFHFLIYGRSNMSRLVAMIESLWLRIGPSLNDLYPEFALSRRGVSNHLRAIRGMRSKDPDAVRSAMENDIRDGYQRLSRCLNSRFEQA